MEYYAPSAHGRKIIGALVPYGQVWCTGANWATKLTTEADLELGGLKLPKGSYSIWTVPGPQEWTLIVNKHTGQWGIPYKYESEELARVPMSVSKTSGPVENFTINLNQTNGSCTLQMSWENTQASIKLSEKK